MIKYLKTFFYPKVLTYSYCQPKELVIAQIEEVFEREVTVLSSKDMKGHFLSEDTFAIDIVSVAYRRGISFTSTLIGKVVESEDGTTQIQTKAKPNGTLYFWFFVALVFGFAYLYQFIQSGMTTSLLWSLAMLFIATALLIGISNVAITTIRERYMMYIDKELKKASDNA